MKTTGKTYDVGIVGAGVMGAAAAYELARRGASVALIDQARLPNPRGASVEHSKIFRFAYPETLYVKMCIEALTLWRELEQASGARLLTPAGLLLMGTEEAGFEGQSYTALRALGLEVERLDEAAMAARYPQFDCASISQVVYDPSGAITHAEAAVRALIDRSRAHGADVFEGERVAVVEESNGGKRLGSEAGNQWQCGNVLIASGPWTRRLLPEVADQLTTTKQNVVYFKPAASRQSFAVGDFPIFLEVESGFYGFPIHHDGALKVSNHLKGAAINPDAPDADDERVGEEFIESCRAFFARRIPALADAEVTETRVCIYNNTPDDDFIIDWHPRLDGVLMVTGFSGHGFKFGPLIGRIAADLLLDGKSQYPLERFQLSRFRRQ